MDPDSEAAAHAVSQFVKPAVVTVVLSTCILCPVSCDDRSVEVVRYQSPDVDKVIIRKQQTVKKKKTLYITFDDGPNKGTRNVLEIIEAEKIPITMFVVGEHVFGSEEQRNTWDSMQVHPFVQLANHSYSHANQQYSYFYSNPDVVTEDFQRCHDTLGLKNQISRTPGRNIWRTAVITSTDIKSSTAAADSLLKKNFTLVGWDLEWHFDPSTLALTESADSLQRLIDSSFVKGRTKTQGHLVLLAHDQAYADSGDSTTLRLFFQALKKRDDIDLQFISEYPRLKD
jgi:peptidoglycan-N-acetylglucosamine deacetylase